LEEDIERAHREPYEGSDLMKKKKALKNKSWARRNMGVTSVIVFLLVWETLYRFGFINPIFLSSPIRIIQVGFQLVQSGTLVEHLMFTLGHFLVGFGLAAIAGISIGLLLGWYKSLGEAFDPFLTAMIGTPRIVLLPLITLWVGVGFASKVLIVFIAGFFPIILNTISGVRSLDRNLLRVGNAFGATPLQIFRTVALPGSIPHIVSGLRVGIGQSLVGVVAAEMFVSTGGIGYFVSQSSANFNIDRVFVGIVVVVLMGMFITWGVKYSELRLAKWRSE
jgi:ABC-type nitrate/sulfonate/bicarbonate transport system permease component